MTGERNWEAGAGAGGTSRRGVLRGIAWAGTVIAPLLTSPRVAAAQDATPGAAGTRPFMGETFIGATSDANTFLAIVVAEATTGEGERQARAYVCNAADIVEWFDQGTVDADGQLALRSPGGMELAGELTADGVTGAITLADGTQLDFATQPASGADGLYTFTLTPDGQVAGSSAGGATIEGQLLVARTITLPDGATGEYEWPVRIDDTAELRTIYREEAGRRGEGKSRKGTRFVVQP